LPVSANQEKDAELRRKIKPFSKGAMYTQAEKAVKKTNFATGKRDDW